VKTENGVPESRISFHISISPVIEYVDSCAAINDDRPGIRQCRHVGKWMKEGVRVVAHRRPGLRISDQVSVAVMSIDRVNAPAIIRRSARYEVSIATNAPSHQTAGKC